MVKTPTRRTTPRIAVINGQPTTTSRDIAETFGKRHDHVLRCIKRLECSPEFRDPNFGAATYIDAQGKPRTQYHITKDGFAFLCMGFTGQKAAQWKERYITHFNRMADKLAQRQARKAAPQPAVSAPAVGGEVDIRAALLSGQCDAKPLPHDVAQAINDRTWNILRDLHPLVVEHIQRRVAYTAISFTGEIDHAAALRSVRSVTLNSALAHQYHEAMRSIQTTLRVAAAMASESASQAMAAYPPRAEVSARRDEDIKRSYDGRNVQDLMLRHGVSRATVYRALQEDGRAPACGGPSEPGVGQG